ncbi:hypothetical protein [Raoultibacter phocaeensis]|uniref:hypothetical protein n=1 Tax=Raoultibacter phocaeensis TaxID=2479841 RepID=UPI001117E020|nr:hypothetical protein [Raoultibacter phocaeensis]
MYIDLSRKVQADLAVVLGSIYCRKLLAILSVSGELSISKLIFLAYFIKRRGVNPHSLFDGKQSRHMVAKMALEASGSIDAMRKDLRYIVLSLEILRDANLVRIEGNRASTLDEEGRDYSGDIDLFSKKVIEASKEIEDSIFIKEVIKNV